VSLFTISSICLLTHSIKKSGNAATLDICICTTSQKSQSLSDQKSTLKEKSSQEFPSKAVIRGFGRGF